MGDETDFGTDMKFEWSKRQAQEMSNQLQEWTVEYVYKDLLRYFPRDKGLCAKIAEAHNAALAAEREKVKTLVEALKAARSQLYRRRAG
jgi:hypothetical protein